MLKIYIAKSEEKRFKMIFNFWASTNSRLFLEKDGISFSNKSGIGKISSNAFIGWSVNGSKHITIPTDKKELKKMLDKWKVVENGCVEISV